MLVAQFEMTILISDVGDKRGQIAQAKQMLEERVRRVRQAVLLV